MIRWTVFLAIALVCVVPTYPQIPSSDECGPYLQVPLPAEASLVPTPKQWPECNSYKLYSGIGTEIDYTAARKCALSERLAQQAGIEPPNAYVGKYDDAIANLYGGSGMLAAIYANGEGIEQNKTLARRFACESAFESALLKQIEAMPTMAHVTEKRINYCGDVAYTTIEMNFCAAWYSEIAAQRREDSLNALMRRWPSEDQDAFKLLQKASDEYVEAHGRGEVYQGGTMRGLRTNGVEEHQRDKFLEAIRSFESGHLPKGTQEDFNKADVDLNATYKKAVAFAAAQNFNEDDGVIRPEGIREAERAWLKYKVAYVNFHKNRYPQTDPNSWLVLLTTNRYWSLRWTMCEVGWQDPACKPR